MSVEIYNVDDTECLLCIGVAGEHTFQAVWEKAIADCHLQYIGNKKKKNFSKKVLLFSIFFQFHCE